MNPADFAILPAESAGDHGPAENRLAEQLGIATTNDADGHSARYLLNYDDADRLQLRDRQHPGQKPYAVTFSPRYSSRGSDPLKRALGAGIESVIDATAGLGVDAFHLAATGCQVTAIEAHPVVYALLEDGWRHCTYPEVKSRLHLVQADAARWIGQLTSPVPVIYLDPMYPARPGTAAPKKGIRLLQHLVPYDAERDSELLRAAMAKVTRRVVVKRPHHAAPILPGKSGDTRGKLVRFDIYPPAT